ncbi:DUF4209 domain-containing protein [Rhodococcus sp. 06-156-3C]|nr:DUF4209 domain-containing protein [Rhodococcus sp. 06-156-3C]OZD27376.1 DUF4209 domain-containing protein [Rhodococcus sp. 06-156-4a]OZD37143.1 DUF4209 domain-containing protein [Rhodococcus sp. 06-156-3b]OZD41073.1 DUF4209 domain-containing protein [Rhodococcus sp. 06-156-3]OZF62224.1 DUF4209 domain-containing protein [Rhodococcus sp. 06-156-4]
MAKRWMGGRILRMNLSDTGRVASDDLIDPSWWEDVLESVSADSYELPELLSPDLANAAKDPAVTGFKELVLQVLATASSAMLNSNDWSEPYTPAMQLGGRRTPLPSDLEASHVALLARIVPLVKHDSLRARAADVAWFYGNRSDVATLDLAIDAYRSTPLSQEVWFRYGRDAWIRALELAIRRGPEGAVRAREMTDVLIGEVIKGQLAENFRTVQIAETLRLHGMVDESGRADIYRSLVQLATQAVDPNPRLSRHLEREAVTWLPKSDGAAKNAAFERIAHTYIAEADARVKTDLVSGAFVEGSFLEKAIAILRTIPRSYRAANELDELIEQLRRRLRESREASVELMMRIQSDPVDLTDYVAYARSQVSGHADKFDALASFAKLAPPMDEARTRETAAEMLEGSISHLFRSETISSDFRKVASTPGSTQGADAAAVWGEMVRTVGFHSQLVATGVIQPAQEILTTDHRFGRQYMVSLCSESPLVPAGHETLWADGLTLGLAGNYGIAISVLVPQLEHAVRVALQSNGVYTLFVDERGVESEKSLNALLDMTEAAEIFGAGMVMEMQALLVTQGGPNLRNDVAHGLLTDASAWSYSAMYIWWFCLRLVMYPVIEMVADARQRASDVTAGRASEAGDPEPTADGASEPDATS